jgi:hypothetical protein
MAPVPTGLPVTQAVALASAAALTGWTLLFALRRSGVTDFDSANRGKAKIISRRVDNSYALRATREV